MSNPTPKPEEDSPRKVTQDAETESISTASSKANDNQSPKPHQPEFDTFSSPGFILTALTLTLTCWLLTGLIGYSSPSLPISDDRTFAGMVLWMFQAGSSICLVVGAVSKGWSTPAATMSASILGAGLALGYGVCCAEWGNAATWAFWMAVGVYGGLGMEAVSRLGEGVERGIARAMGVKDEDWKKIN